MIESSFAITGTFIAYLLLMVAIGVYAYKKTSSSSDYFLGGRSLGPWPAALSAGASDMVGCCWAYQVTRTLRVLSRFGLLVVCWWVLGQTG